MKEYLLPIKSLEELASISLDGSFEEIYNRFTKIFFDKSRLRDKEPSMYSEIKENLRKTIIVEGKNNEVYNGSLWQNPDLEYIGLMDYLYTVPLWDWWIDGLFPRKIHRSRNRSLIVIRKETRQTPIDNIKTILSEEGYHIVDTKSLGNNRESIAFQEMLLEIYPRKIAYETNRIAQHAFLEKFSKIGFVLRGGLFIRSVLNDLINESKVFYLNLDIDCIVDENTLVVDDCIGSVRTLNKILSKNGSRRIHFATLDSTLPPRIYRKYFPNVDFYLPETNLNIYSCRLFEENPPMMGYLEDTSNPRGFNLTNNLIRQNLLDKIKFFSEERNLLNEINERLARIKNFD